MKVKVVSIFAVLMAVLLMVPVSISAVETQGDATYINVNESDYWTLTNGTDDEGNALEWGFWEAEGQYGGVQLFAYGYPQETEEPLEGWVMPAATFSFKGTYVGVISIPGYDQGWMDIYVDGVFQTTIRSTLDDCEDPEPIWEDVNSVLLWSIDGLEDTVHTITITPTAYLDWEEDINWSKCNVDAIVIEGEPVKASEVTVPELTKPEPTEPPATTAPAQTTPPKTTAPKTEAPSSTTAVTTATLAPTTPAETQNADSNPIVWIVVVIAVVAAVGISVFFLAKKKK